MVVVITEKVIAELVESNEYTKAQGEKIANLVMKYAEEKSSELENKPNRQGSEKLATPPDREDESSKTEWRPLAQRRQQRAEAEMRLVVGDYAIVLSLSSFIPTYSQ
jgi:polyhydroxyalkanoate synthesis regulator phasin